MGDPVRPSGAPAANIKIPEAILSQDLDPAIDLPGIQGG
jgi:hypothetical protein